MIKNYNAQLLINSIQNDHQYSVTGDFKEKYFRFLDDIVDEVGRKNQIVKGSLGGNRGYTGYSPR